MRIQAADLQEGPQPDSSLPWPSPRGSLGWTKPQSGPTSDHTPRPDHGHSWVPGWDRC